MPLACLILFSLVTVSDKPNIFPDIPLPTSYFTPICSLADLISHSGTDLNVTSVSLDHHHNAHHN